jgi:hypothetical protein
VLIVRDEGLPVAGMVAAGIVG